MRLLNLFFSYYSLMFIYAEGCMRCSDSSNLDKITFTVNNETIPENHRLNCTDNETQSLACLNGGSCFAIYVEDRIVQCACFTKYIGSRCEMIDPEIIFDQTRQRKVRIGYISGFGGLGYLLLIVFLAIVYKKCTKQSGDVQNSDPSAIPLTNTMIKRRTQIEIE
ncbi:uncharacterized protein LOC127734743 [Mytilus californianus]|uniref:uncharacterized protein LOC127734743 n=1 Tax=Mytilus californianus TaxID=6549 RepID=UPI0022459948|nr:uncharacterized protein LOC127734743 [Mytilus californianus]